VSTKISWCDETINPVVGCSKISEGCQNCYAENMAARLASMGFVQYRAVTSSRRWNGRAEFVPSELQKPDKWKKPRSIFVCSMGDLFHEWVQPEWIDRVMRMAWNNKRHTFILLTKRPENMLKYFIGLAKPGTGTDTAKRLLMNPNYTQQDHGWHMRYLRGDSLQNLVLGVSAENQGAADKRIGLLLQTPAAKRFVSLEPMIGPVDLDRIHEAGEGEEGSHWESWYICIDGKRFDPWSEGWINGFPRLDGVILGGESGRSGRRLEPQWAMKVRDQCHAAGVPFMFKQWHHENRNEVNPSTGFPLLGSCTHSELAWAVNRKES